MCLGIPAQIVEIPDPARAKVAISGVERMIATDLLLDEELAVGDWVLVHVGFALSKIDEEEAAQTLTQIERLGGDVLADEVDSFTTSRIE
ncbi:HypC/HybG/HupF family hydrogenase formation chaperone [Corynebacterium sp. NPDC060344]|uniref:HypC/HybG/HupF family hydrogenase formation chaperone n=1 Tax=Corynebacterium sp. NPDC060344 TaxID=3347101 RepID=UPI003661B544